MSAAGIVKGVAVLAVAGLGAYVLVRGLSFGKGLITGDNALTQNARDSDGNKVDAYTGIPVAGTLGAAANAASGGYLATLGGWLGRSTYDLFHPAEPEPSGPQASYDETDRLLKRYPSTNEPSSILSGWDGKGLYADTPGLY